MWVGSRVSLAPTCASRLASLSKGSLARPAVTTPSRNRLRRAGQFSDLELAFRPIPLEEIGICVHSDSAFDRDDEGKPQYGFFVGFCEQKLGKDEPSMWCPAMWKSSRVKRACSSTLSAESQAALDGTQHDRQSGLGPWCVKLSFMSSQWRIESSCLM